MTPNSLQIILECIHRPRNRPYPVLTRWPLTNDPPATPIQRPSTPDIMATADGAVSILLRNITKLQMTQHILLAIVSVDVVWLELQHSGWVFVFSQYFNMFSGSLINQLFYRYFLYN